MPCSVTACHGIVVCPEQCTLFSVHVRGAGERGEIRWEEEMIIEGWRERIAFIKYVIVAGRVL